MEVWNEETVQDAIVIEKAVKAIKFQTINFCWRKLCPDVVVHDLIELMTETIKEIMEEIVAMAKTVGR